MEHAWPEGLDVARANGRTSSQSLITVVFDFDLTLTRWDTADRLFRWLLKSQPWRAAIVVLMLPVLLPLLLIPHTRKWPVRFAVWVATLGRDEAALARIAQAYVRAMPSGASQLFLDDGLAQLRDHLARGHRVVVATGCLEVLARALLDRASLAEVQVVGSTMQPRWGGLVVRAHCYGANKQPMLSARGFAPPWQIAYTDHRCDLPVLQQAEHCILINPRPRCLAALRAGLATPPTVLAWH
jgi:phosphatidylglycerophosphatase C